LEGSSYAQHLEGQGFLLFREDPLFPTRRALRTVQKGCTASQGTRGKGEKASSGLRVRGEKGKVGPSRWAGEASKGRISAMLPEER